MFTGLKTQHELTDCLINDIVPREHDLVKLKKVLNWEGMRIIDHSTLVKVRKWPGDERIQKIERLFTEELIAKKLIAGKYFFLSFFPLSPIFVSPQQFAVWSFGS